MENRCLWLILSEQGFLMRFHFVNVFWLTSKKGNTGEGGRHCSWRMWLLRSFLHSSSEQLPIDRVKCGQFPGDLLIDGVQIPLWLQHTWTCDVRMSAISYCNVGMRHSKNNQFIKDPLRKWDDPGVRAVLASTGTNKPNTSFCLTEVKGFDKAAAVSLGPWRLLLLPYFPSSNHMNRCWWVFKK